MHGEVRTSEIQFSSPNMMLQIQQISGYADDIALIGRNIVALKELFHELEKEGKQIGLNINDIKIKYMKISNKQNTGL